MNVDNFLLHHGITENPFVAEEARHDPVFDRLVVQANQNHPDFAKILGRIDQPSTAVVFGEKGSGKTAIRLLVGRKVALHNQEHPQRRTLLVAYDDLNIVLDQVVGRRQRETGRRLARGSAAGNPLDCLRLEDHQDAILSLAVTRLTDALLDQRHGGGNGPALLPAELNKRIKALPRRRRVDLAVLAAIYDQPFSGAVVARWQRLRSRLRLGWRPSVSFAYVAALVTTLLAVGLTVASSLVPFLPGPVGTAVPSWAMPVAAISAVAGVILWLLWLRRHLRLWQLCRGVRRETPAINRTTAQLHQMLAGLAPSDVIDQTWPTPSTIESNSRYNLTGRLLEVLGALDYVGMIVLVDRVDEPTLVGGQVDRMRAVVWPMLDNKFLQQHGVGVKLLLPMELSYVLRRESAEFFQEARLDKQNLVDPLTWSGATLYDLCSTRLRACQAPGGDPIYLTNMFESDVTREMLVDALDQMHQPRDAFKFLYSVVQEHCRIVPEDHAQYTIPRLVLEGVRRQQSQRVQAFYRGLSPA